MISPYRGWQRPPTLQTVLFDVDGTLFDTAPDLLAALNQLCRIHCKPELSLPAIRSHIGDGIKGLLQLAFAVNEHHSFYPVLVKQLRYLYQDQCLMTTQPFPAITTVLAYLEQRGLPWGIVTNKPSCFTFTLLRTLLPHYQPHCIVCSDTLYSMKPSPRSILHACRLLRCSPYHTLYIGDAESDVIAAHAAGNQALIVLYGYFSVDHHPGAWRADGYIKAAEDIITWLEYRRTE